jgi:hypothetical protein
MLGCQPLDTIVRRDIATIILRSWTFNQQRENAWREIRSETRREEYIRFCQRVRSQWGLLNTHDKDQERQLLLEVINAAIADVQEKLALAEAREAKEAAIEADCLAFDSSEEGERLRRFEMAAYCKFLRTLDSFMKVRKAGFQETDETVGSAGLMSSQEASRSECEPEAESPYFLETDEQDCRPEIKSKYSSDFDQPDPDEVFPPVDDPKIDTVAHDDAIDSTLPTATLTKIEKTSGAVLPTEAPVLPQTSAENLRNDPNSCYKVEPSSSDTAHSESRTGDPDRAPCRSERGNTTVGNCGQELALGCLFVRRLGAG